VLERKIMKATSREPQARNKWLAASDTSHIPAAFDQAERRDPARQRERVALAA
jgi:hypothetical protein